MIRVLIKLAGIFALAYTAVHLGYARLEKELLTRSCCGIAELPVSEPVKQGVPARKDDAPQQTVPSVEPNSPLRRLPAHQPIDYENPDFQIIVRRNIFQLMQADQPETTQQTEEAQPEAIVEDAPPTSINLTLQGTIMGDDEVARAIIIEDKQNEQKLYRIGDAVQGAIIESIERGKVILEVFGARETLLMEKRKGGGPRLPSPPARITPPVPQRPPDLMNENIDAEEERQVQATRRAPRIRPHRRINFRRNPLRDSPDTVEDTPVEDIAEEDELLPEDGPSPIEPIEEGE